MSFNAWLTSASLIEAVKRKISMPISQGLMSEQDILDFASEELLISMVPSVLSFHQEYFVWQDSVSLVPGKTKYPIPERAIGMNLRDLWYKDASGNLYEMSRIAADDKGSFQMENTGPSTVQHYYMQGNNYVLTGLNNGANSGSLQVEYFLRPSRLVPDERACYIASFLRYITVDNASLVAGDSVTVAGRSFVAGTDFAIGLTSALTAANLASAIGSSGVVTSAASNSAEVTIETDDLDLEISVSNSTGTVLSESKGVKTTDTIPDNIVSGVRVDILQTRPGHSMRGMDIRLPTGSVSADQIKFAAGTFPTDVDVGDYIALAGESIIPMIPTDLHTDLADRTCARILAAIGDQMGVETINQKLSETEIRRGSLLSNRVEGSLPKVVGRSSLLKHGKRFSRRGF